MSNKWLKGTLTTLKRLLHSIRLRAVVGSLQSRNTSTEKQLKNLYTHCFQVSLETFIRCLLHNDFSGLVQQGNPSQCDRRTAWDYLYMEYCDLSGSVSEKRILSLGREIGMLETKLLLIRTCVLILSIRYSQKASDLLAKNGYKYKFLEMTKEQYMDTLARIIKISRSVEVAIEQKLYEHDKLRKKYAGEKVTEAYFDELLVELSRFMGDILHRNQVTLTEFIAIRNRYEKECRQQARQQEQMKQRGNKYKNHNG